MFTSAKGAQRVGNAGKAKRANEKMEDGRGNKQGKGYISEDTKAFLYFVVTYLSAMTLS